MSDTEKLRESLIQGIRNSETLQYFSLGEEYKSMISFYQGYLNIRFNFNLFPTEIRNFKISWEDPDTEVCLSLECRKKFKDSEVESLIKHLEDWMVKFAGLVLELTPEQEDDDE